jgi:hypothetical protein
MEKVKSSIAEYFDKQIAEQDRQDKLYPDRHKVIHKVPCKNCPSAIGKLRGEEDPECKEIKETCSKGLIVNEFLFVCAWRPSKLCKGNCDYMEITEEDISNLSK